MTNLKNTKTTKPKKTEVTETPEVEVQTEVETSSEETTEVVAEVPNITVAPEVEEPDVVLTEEVEAKKVPDKKVKVRLNCDHKCHIGTTNYHFIKGKVYTVPQNVKTILQRAGLLSAI